MTPVRGTGLKAEIWFSSVTRPTVAFKVPLSSRSEPKLPTVLLQNAGIATAYLVTSIVGRRFGWVDSFPGPVWPPSGVTIACVLLFGRRLLPGVAVGSMVAGLLRGAPFLLSSGFMVANVVEPLICAQLLNGVRFRSDLGRLKSLARYLGAVAVGSGAAATIGAGCLAVWLGTSDRFWAMWRVWFSGNAMGAILLGTTLLTWHQSFPKRPTLPRFLEGVSLFAILFFVCRQAFPPLAQSGVTSVASLLLFPLQMWAAARFGPRGCTAAAMMAGIIGIWDMSQLLAGQPEPVIRERLMLLQAFIATFSLAGLTLASALEERSRAEEESRLFLGDLARSLERFRALVSGLPDTLVRFSAAGVVVDAIAPAQGLFASEVETMVGRPLADRLPAALAAQLMEAASAALAGAGLQVIQARLSDGLEGRHVEARVVKAGADEVLATLHDITEHRQLQARLLLSDRMASVGTLAAGVAHEINNPLSFVIANQALLQEHLNALRDRDPSPPIAECLELLKESAEGTERVRRIVRDLKIFSRGHDDDATGATDLRHALDRSIALAWNEIRHKARLVKQYGDVPRLSANEARLGQVFLNLLVNAAQAIPEGNVEGNEIRIQTRVEAGRAVIEIRDTGSGIAKANLPRIFDPFFTTKPVGVGTGLGLAICHQIVTAAGGEFEVESDLGKGTLFRIRLPLYTGGEKETPPALAKSAPAPVRRSVLVVDDELLLARSLKRLLSPEHDVESAGSGREALALLGNGRRFDVILCDLMMPELSGMDLHAELSRSAPELAARMVFLTGGAFTPSAREFLERVPNPRVEKPFNLEELKRIVRDAAAGGA